MGAAMLAAAQLRGPDVFAPYLWWDFTKRHGLPPGATYSRTGTKYLWNPNTALYEPYGANVHAPDYNPLTGACRGFLSELSRTNLCTYSSGYNASAWSSSTTSTSKNSLIRGSSAFVATPANGSQSIYRNVVTVPSNSPYTLSWILEVDPAAAVADWAFGSQYGSTVRTRVMLNTTTGVTTLAVGSPVHYSATKLRSVGPNGGAVYALVVCDNYSSGETVQIFAYPRFGGTPTSSFILHHCQVTAGEHAGSPIVTGSGTVALGGDAMYIPSLPTWFNQAQHTLFASVERSQKGAAAANVILSVNDGSNAHRSYFACAPASYGFTVIYSNAAIANIASASAAGGTYKIAGSAKLDEFRAAVNGAALTEDTVGSPMPPITRISIGCDGSNVRNADGWVQAVGIAPVTRTNAELQALTAP